MKWENRFESCFQGQNCFVSLDGTDYRIPEPTPFDRKWYSHKFNGPGIRYEVGLCLQTGSIVWANGGFPCGAFPDLKIAREAYIYAVEENEMTLADRGYNDEKYFIFPSTNDFSSAQQKKFMARHETINMRLKRFGVLQNRFRHCLSLHPKCFYAVLNLTQLLIENGEPMYDI